MEKKINVLVRRKTGSTRGRTPKNLPDVHVDELITEIPKMDKPFNKVAEMTWSKICETLIHRDKLKPNHLILINQCANAYAISTASIHDLEYNGFTRETSQGFRPAIHVIRTSYATLFSKLYNQLGLDPKAELYDCMATNVGRGQIELSNEYDNF